MYYYNQLKYDNIKYPSANHPKSTIKTGGCGVCSAAMCINNLAGKELYTVKKMAEFSMTNGGRALEGTNMKNLLKALTEKHKDDFYFTTTDNSKVVLEHIKSGGVAIAHQGNSYNVFSNNGHYVACMGVSGNNIVCYDPAMYEGKFKKYDRAKRVVKETKYGAVVPCNELNKCTIDRFPGFYLIGLKENSKYKKKKIFKKDVKFKVGNVYTLLYNMNVRSKPAGTIKKRSDLTPNAKLHAMVSKDAILKKGTKVTCKEVRKVGGIIWIRIPSGWIAGYKIIARKQYIK